MRTGVKLVNTLQGEYPDFKFYKSIDTKVCSDSLKVTFKWFIKRNTLCSVEEILFICRSNISMLLNADCFY